MPGGAVPAGLFTGPPGGITGPPGGMAPQALAPLTLLAPMPGAMQAGGLAPPPAGAGTRPGGAMPLAGTPAYGPGAGGSPAPGAGAPLALPDLGAAARQAIESVVERAEAAPPAGSASSRPTVAASHAQPAVPIGGQTPHVAAAPTAWSALPPAPPPGSGAASPVAGVWRAPPPAPAGGQIDRSGWHDAYAAQDRDLAQRIGDGLHPLVERLQRKPVGWVIIVVLFGLVVPIILLRRSFDVRLRLVLSALVFIFWLGLIQDVG
jgi:hypothetical protein